jgi:hypothetical protein
VGEVGVVRVVAGPGQFTQPVDDGADLVVFTKDCVVEGEDGFEAGHGACVTDESGDLHGEAVARRSRPVRSRAARWSSSSAVSGWVKARTRALGLAGAFAGDAVLLGLVAGGGVGGGRAVHVAVGRGWRLRRFSGLRE